MSEKRVNKRIRKLLEQDLAEAVADVLRAEAMNFEKDSQEQLQKDAEMAAKTLGRFEAAVRQGPPPPTPIPGPGVAKWGAG